MTKRKFADLDWDPDDDNDYDGWIPSEESEEIEDLDINEIHDIDEIEERISDLDNPRTNKTDYVNEHILCCLMSMFRNWDGKNPKSIIFREDYKVAKIKFDAARITYQQCLNEGCDKRSQRVQTAFNEMLTLSAEVYPGDKEIKELYDMISLISFRCVPIYGRGYQIDADDVIGSTFERWMKYCHNFDPLKKSEISGLRVNAFAYMTQIIKNTIFEMVNKIKRKHALEEKLKGDMLLYESYDEENKAGINDLEDEATNENEIIRMLMLKAPEHRDIKKLVKEIEAEGFTESEILRTIGSFELLNPLNDVMFRNLWNW